MLYAETLGICTDSIYVLELASVFVQEILQLVMVKNLDTGECKPLSEVETIAPKGTDPISLHIMKLTSDFGRYLHIICEVVLCCHIWKGM